MQVRVRLYASLRKHVPAGTGEDGFLLELPDGATVADLIARLGFPAEHAGMIVSNNEHLKMASVLEGAQEVHVFPPLAGGCATQTASRKEEGDHAQGGKQRA